MASLSVRKLDDNTYERLRVRTAQHGGSMEEAAHLLAVSHDITISTRRGFIEI